MQKIRIIVASSNTGKIREIALMLGEKYEVVSKKDAGIFDEIEESAPDFMGNALLKARGIFDLLKEMEDTLVLSDDSGLCVEKLDGEPGVYSARYANKEGVGNASDEANRHFLIDRLHQVGCVQSPAKFVASMVLYGNLKGKPICLKSQGECEGIVFDNERGEGGFGYDSLFQPLGYEKRMAELSNEEKNQISHRAKALRALILELEEKNA